MRRRIAVSLALLACAVAAPPATAKVAVHSACRAEAEKYCKEPLRAKKRGPEKVFRCLLDMSPVLVEPCRKLVEAMAACREDSRRWCKGRISDDGWRCLLARARHTSDRCRALIQAPPPPPPDLDDIGACGVDFERFCAEVAPGDGREWACLARHLEELSAECRADLDRPRPAPKPRGLPRGGVR